MQTRGIRKGLAVALVSLGLLGLGACGGGDDSTTAGVGACIDESSAVVDCGDASATQKLLSDQTEPDAIACVAIGDKPQTEVTLDGTPYCAEDL